MSNVNHSQVITNELMEIKVFEALVGLFKSLARVRWNDSIQDAIEKVVDTIFVISNLKMGEKRVVLSESGETYSIEEYEVCDALECLVSSRGFTFNDDEFCEDLRAEAGVMTEMQQRYINNVKDDFMKTYLQNMPISMKAKVVPLSPVDFRAAQLQMINAVKGNVDRWTSIEELSNPILLSSVKAFMNSEFMIATPDGDWNVIPVYLPVSESLFKPFKFVIPIDEYVKKLAFHVVNSMM